jgi:ribose transport system substrate-binding protein
MALGAVRAAIAAGRIDEISIFGIDAIDDAVEAIKNGEMVATVQQQPYLQMQMAVIAAQRILNGADVEPLVIVPLKLITAEDL